MAGALIIFLGAVSAIVGIFISITGINSVRYVRQLETMPELHLSDINNDSVGRKGYIEGTLSLDSPTAEANMVAYHRSVYAGVTRRRETSPQMVSGYEYVDYHNWHSDGYHRPPLSITADGKTVTLRGEEYSLSNFTTSWVDTAELEVGVSLKYEGFVPGDAIAVLGEIVMDTDYAPVFLVKKLSGESFEALQGAYESGATFALIAGPILAVVGIILVGVGVAILS